MNLPPKAVKEFRQLYYQDFGENLSTEQASEKLANLVNLVRVIYYPKSNKRYADTQPKNQ